MHTNTLHRSTNGRHTNNIHCTYFKNTNTFRSTNYESITKKRNNNSLKRNNNSFKRNDNLLTRNNNSLKRISISSKRNRKIFLMSVKGLRTNTTETHVVLLLCLFDIVGLYNWNYWLIDFIVLNATFNNISAISWRPVLVVEEAGVPGENHRPWASNW